MFNYIVVKFKVNVRLVEKSVKSHEGSVMVAKVIVEYRKPGITAMTGSITLLNR